MNDSITHEQVMELTTSLGSDIAVIDAMLVPLLPLRANLTQLHMEYAAVRLRNTVRMLRLSSSVLVAAKYILETLANIGGKVLLRSVKTFELESSVKSIHGIFEMYGQNLKDKASSLFISSEDSESLHEDNITEQVTFLRNEVSKVYKTAQLLSRALCLTVRGCPIADGELSLLVLLCEKADNITIEAVDKALDMGGGVMVPLMEAPLLQYAMQTNNHQSIHDIVDRLAEKI